jgi:hypothetical protein
MTLVEVLVALTLAGSITTIGYALWQQSLAARDRAHAVLAPVSRAATARALIEGWLAAARTAGGEDADEFQGAADVLMFLSNDARPLTDAPALMRLVIDTDSLTRERGLIAEVWDAIGQHRRMELIPEAAAVNLEYFGSIGEARQWWPSWHSAARLPEAVRLTVTPMDSVRTVNGIPIIVLLAGSQ